MSDETKRKLDGGYSHATGEIVGSHRDLALRAAYDRGEAWLCKCGAITGNHRKDCWRCYELRAQNEKTYEKNDETKT